MVVSVYLEAVAQAREARDNAHHAEAQADAQFRAALIRARQHHSLREIAPYAGISYAGVAFLTKQENDDV